MTRSTFDASIVEKTKNEHRYPMIIILAEVRSRLNKVTHLISRRFPVGKPTRIELKLERRDFSIHIHMHDPWRKPVTSAFPNSSRATVSISLSRYTYMYVTGKNNDTTVKK